MWMMNNETKSIAYAFVANGVQIYLGDQEDQFITSKLICSECGGPWYMNLTECFLCGAINEFLYRCSNCGEFVSITNSGGKCSKCGSEELYMVCPNPDCISNQNPKLLEEINSYGGVFNKNSGFLISQQYCLYCGSQFHIYKNYKIKIITLYSAIVNKGEIYKSFPQLDDETYVIIRAKTKEKISYGVFRWNELNNDNKELIVLYPNFSNIVDLLYPVNKSNDSNL